MILLNLFTKILGYKDAQGVVNNPLQRSFDWQRNYLSIPAQNGTSDELTIPPGQTVTIFDGVRTLPEALNPANTVFSLTKLSGATSNYRLAVTAGDGEFRTPRTLGMLSTTQITVGINNNAVATFTIDNVTTESFSSVQVGDVLRIKGFETGDTSGVAFNSVNSGYWVILAINSSSKITARRAAGRNFSGGSETVTLGATDTANQMRIYSSAGVQAGDTISFSGSLTPSTFGDYQVLQVGPDFLDFISGTPLAEETGVDLVSSSDIILYSNAKKLVYVEADQNAAVRFNAQTDNQNIITPIQVNDKALPGFISKWGNSYKCVVTNLSQVDSLNIKYILAE